MVDFFKLAEKKIARRERADAEAKGRIHASLLEKHPQFQNAAQETTELFWKNYYHLIYKGLEEDPVIPERFMLFPWRILDEAKIAEAASSALQGTDLTIKPVQSRETKAAVVSMSIFDKADRLLAAQGSIPAIEIEASRRRRGVNGDSGGFFQIVGSPDTTIAINQFVRDLGVPQEKVDELVQCLSVASQKFPHIQGLLGELQRIPVGKRFDVVKAIAEGVKLDGAGVRRFQLALDNIETFLDNGSSVYKASIAAANSGEVGMRLAPVQAKPADTNAALAGPAPAPAQGAKRQA